MTINGDLKGELGEVILDEIKFGIYHGTNNELKQNLINSKKYDILVCGHTHKREPESSGVINNNQKTFVLNPGSAHRKSVSLSGFFDQIGRIIILIQEPKEYHFIGLSK